MTTPASDPQSSSRPRLAGHVALVTGASRGIGAATALRLAQDGAAVGVNYVRNEAAAQAVVAAITDAGGRALAVAGDASDRGDVERMAAAVVAAFGPIDTLVLNAAAVKNFVIAPFLSSAWDDVEDMILGEVKAVWVPAHVLAPAMVERRRGSIVVVSSGLSRSSAPGFSSHSAGKSACDALARSLALELGPHGIRVNVVAPGLTETDASAAHTANAGAVAYVIAGTPLGRIARPQDIAGTIAFLASDDAGFVTGSYLPVSGGVQML